MLLINLKNYLYNKHFNIYKKKFKFMINKYIIIKHFIYLHVLFKLKSIKKYIKFIK